MGDMREAFREMKYRSKGKKAANRARGAETLEAHRIPFLVKNGGAHLIVRPEDPFKRADYWPGTGLWRNYWGSVEGRGVDSLLAWLRAQ